MKHPDSAPTPSTASGRPAAAIDRLRRPVWRWLAAAAALAALALALAENRGWPWLRQPLQHALTRAVGAAVTLDGPFQLHLLGPPALRVEHLHVASGSRPDLPYLLDARQLELAWRWSDLWRWQRGSPLRVHRLQAEFLQAYLVRDDAGTSSWQPGRTQERPADAGAAEWPRVGSLRVNNGQVVVDDAPLRTRLRIALRGGEGEPPAQDAGYKISIDGHYRAMPMALQVRSGGALPLLRDAQSEAPSGDVPLHIEGRAGAAWLRFDGHAAALLGDRRLRGSLQLRGPSLAQVAEPLGLTLPRTPPFDLKAQLAHAAGVWHLQAERAVIGSSLLNGDFRLDTRVQPPLLQGRLGGRRLGLVDLGPAVGVTDTATPARGRVLPQRPFDLPSLRDMDADVQVAIDELDFGSEALNPLLGLRAQLLLQRGVLRLQDLRAHVAGGRFRGSTSLDPNVEPARWTVDLRFDGVDIAGWVEGVRPAKEGDAPRRPRAAVLKQQREQARAGGAQPVRAYITGELMGAVKATGHGRSVAQILGSLDGRAQLMLRDGTLSHLATEALGLDVAESLGVLMRGDQPLPLRCGWLDLALQGGVVQPQLAVFDNADTEVRITGQVNLRDESLALRLVARPKDVSPFTLRAPVTVHGSLAEPEIGVEGERLAAKALAAAALGAVAGPLAAWLPFIDLGVGDEQDACVRRPSVRAGAPVASSPAR